MEHQPEIHDLRPALRQRQKRRDKRLHEELIECRRRGGGDYHRKTRAKGSQKALQKFKSDGEMPFHEGIRHLAKHNFKTSPEDNLEPLERWLAAQVGRPWAEVYAELGKIAQPNSMHGQHIRQHLWGYVYKNAWFDSDDNLLITNQYGWITRLKSSGFQRSYRDYYFVHPTTGRLEKIANYGEKKPNQPTPKKARFKKEKEKLRWKIRQGKTQKTEPNRDNIHDPSGPKILTKGRALEPGRQIEIGNDEYRIRGVIENISESNTVDKRLVGRKEKRFWVKRLTLRVRVVQVIEDDYYRVGQSYYFEFFQSEKMV